MDTPDQRRHRCLDSGLRTQGLTGGSIDRDGPVLNGGWRDTIEVQFVGPVAISSSEARDA
jgi:hypothetical protein